MMQSSGHICYVNQFYKRVGTSQSYDVKVVRKGEIDVILIVRPSGLDSFVKDLMSLGKVERSTAASEASTLLYTVCHWNLYTHLKTSNRLHKCHK